MHRLRGVRQGLHHFGQRLAVPAGALKIRYIFLPACRNNLTRIEALAEPKVWQFFRPGFFLFLVTMISLGASMSRWAEGNYGAMIAVASIDLALTVALVGSLRGFKQESGARSQEP